MGWFKSSVKRQQDHVFEIVNPLFGQTAQGEQQQQQGWDFQPEDVSPWGVTQFNRPADVWDQPSATSASEATLRSLAGLRQSDSSGALQMQQGMPLTRNVPTADGPSHSSNGTSGRVSSSSMRNHAPAPLLLPADESSACAGAAGDDACQGLAGEGCYTPGTVGSISPRGPLHVPAAHVKPSAHAGPTLAAASAHASVSTPKAAHRLSCSTAMGFNHAAAGAVSHGVDSNAKHAGQHSVIVLQSPETGSSSGSDWSASTTGICSQATVSGVCLAVGQAFSQSASLPATSTAGRLSHAGAAQQQQRATSRPVSALQWQLQLQLQPQQQQSSPAAAADWDEDDLLADLTACLGSLEVAAQLARTQSGMKPDKLPASIAAFRQSSAGGACSRSNSGRYSLWGKASIESGAVAATNGTNAMLRGSGSDDGAVLGAAAAWTSSNSSDSLGSDGSRPTAGMQLARGRSRLQTTTSNACLWDPAQAIDVFDNSCSDEVSTYSQVSLQHAVGSGNHSKLVLKVGERSQAFSLADASKAPSPPCRSSSNHSSNHSSNSSTKEGSVHDGQHNTLRHSLDIPATDYISSGVPRRTVSAAGAAAQPRHASAPKPVQVNAQEEYECYQKALALQQEQQQLQERRQHRQEQVVASYSCLGPSSPHRPTSHSSTCSDCGFSSDSSSTARSRPSSSKDTPSSAPAAGAAASEASSRASTDGKWTIPASTDPAPACGGNTAAACCAGVGTTPSSLEDAWAAIQAHTCIPAAAPASQQPGSRPTSASVRPTSASTGSSSSG